ncbi:ABC transporter substrate-binding protein [Salinibacterium sp. SWN167]|uniref:ABC transporter substrate-binding protein n=1 Tax=Salinibacterium sp. SWN167 TaxID=2792054 RepID=UPI0018CD6F15|nr:ABC transporter substrate-binding protein [Salinibacterium sp. SWN167]MBH0082163.1 ABC transporter substrate-binding protein [Salinibacterium sp. SWN167]
MQIWLPFRRAASPTTARRRILPVLATAAVTALALSACSAPTNTPRGPEFFDWADVQIAADGQTVKLWMWGGDDQGNAYVDDVLAPAAAAQGVTLERVPIADTKDALNRVFTELQAGRNTDGAVDLVWINGDNFRTGKQADAWFCEWTDLLPNMTLVSDSDPLLTEDFGTPVDGCEAPWHKAQFSFVYNEATVPNPPTTIEGILDWAEDNPGRFTYPAAPDFTGSAFLREVLYSVSGGYENVPSVYSDDAFAELSPALYERLDQLAPSLWREGTTYPATSEQLTKLFADGEIDMMMTYGPATLTALVENGTLPETTRVLTVEDGTLGNASFFGIPSNSGNIAGAMVVANEALSVEQQVAKADPAVWGQFTVLDLDALSADDRALFDALPQSPVVPTFDILSQNANPELSAEWVPALDDGWRTTIAAR